MLQIVIPASEAKELWDERNERFIHTPSIKEQRLRLEHSLVSLSKWESKWCKPFFHTMEKTNEETIDYIRCMTLDSNVDPNVYFCLTDENLKQITEYIEAPMTATYISDNSKGPSREKVTSELIYYWMIALNIPFECQKWHINRLLTLIRVCERKSTPPKKMSRQEIARRNAALNAERRKRLNTKG